MVVLSDRIDHIGIAVENLDAAVRTYELLVGARPVHFEEVADQKVKTAFFKLGASHIELLKSTDPHGPIGRFIHRQGRGGIHHICFSVSDIHAKLKELEEAGFQLIDREPRRGAQNKLVAFVHPKSTGGVLIELSQEKED